MAEQADFTEPILHVDMDAFFVEVERLSDPSLRGKPVVVGGTGGRAVVAAASYEARQYGIGSAMPMVHARRLLPDLVVVPPNHHRYRDASSELFEVFRSFTPLVEGLSLDEAFLDIGGLRMHYETSVAVAAEVRSEIRNRLGLPSSVGVGSSKLIAKLASVEAKPDGVHHVPQDRELDYLHGLNVRALLGVGEATHVALEQLGITTIGDMARTPVEVLVARLGSSMGHDLGNLANAVDDREVVPDSSAKSVSVEETYETDLRDLKEIETEILRHAERLAARLRRAGLVGRTIVLKIRLADFRTSTRRATLASPTDVAREIYKEGRSLLRTVDRVDEGVRLVGLGATNLQRADEPVQLAADQASNWADVSEALDQISQRFGTDAIMPARLADRSGESRGARQSR